ncbi:MAG: response regulator [Candidatus Omnitrophica bacterium]|nr:response regulator [Candidatus Omnitrophota bacterium]
MAKKILIIDDEKDILKMLEVRLEAQGYEVVTALDGAEGLEKAQSLVPDLVILDINLPEVNGFTVCRILKDNEVYKNVPIMMLTAREGEFDEVVDETLKPDAYCYKPFDSDELVAKVKELLGE